MDDRHYLLLLVLVVIAGLWVTGNPSAAPAIHKTRQLVPGPAPVVDQKPLQTARKLAASASTPEEQDYAREALRLADFGIDLAFAGALREATEHPPAPTPRAARARRPRVESR